MPRHFGLLVHVAETFHNFCLVVYRLQASLHLWACTAYKQKWGEMSQPAISQQALEHLVSWRKIINNFISKDDYNGQNAITKTEMIRTGGDNIRIGEWVRCHHDHVLWDSEPITNN